MIVVEHKGGGPGDKEGVGRPHLIDTDLDTRAVLADMVLPPDLSLALLAVW